MVIIQVAYEVPAAIKIGLDSGTLMRFGSVIRDNKRIVKHLKETPISTEANKSLLSQVVSIVKNHKVIAIGVGVTVAVGGIIYAVIKSKKNNLELSVPQCVIDFKEALSSYLEAVSNGTLDIDIINKLMLCLDEIENNNVSSTISIDFSVKQLKALGNMVFDYTKKLAKINSFKLNGLAKPSSTTADNAVIDLRRYLEIQKKVFENAS